MATPLVSVIIPVYNTAAYLDKAIQSIVSQHYTELEIIIINDGSTDASDKIISQYKDPRIRYVQNEGNKGLVYTLNRGLALATGEWIARMDGDDISLPERIQQQVRYVLENPEVSVLASTVALIDAGDQPMGQWDDDVQHTSPESIRTFLPRNNCLAHPSILAKTSLMKEYGYRQAQKQAEDYDLWLRLAAGGVVIHKLDQPLLLHRILPHSFTRSRQQNVFHKLAITKFRFVRWALGKGIWNSFVAKTALLAIADQAKALGKSLKRSL